MKVEAEELKDVHKYIILGEVTTLKKNDRKNQVKQLVEKN